jgi:hypothetical protein
VDALDVTGEMQSMKPEKASTPKSTTSFGECASSIKSGEGPKMANPDYYYHSMSFFAKLTRAYHFSILAGKIKPEDA